MIDPILNWARHSWYDWFGTPAETLVPAVLAGGPAHRNRFAVFVFEKAERRPRVFIKVALDADERQFIEGEATAVGSLGTMKLELIDSHIPRFYSSVAIGGAFAAAYGALPGRRVLVPQVIGRVGAAGRRSMIRFWDMTSEFGTHLASATPGEGEGDERALGERVERFLAQFEVGSGARRALSDFRRVLESERIRWHSAWQHGDLAVGNVLVDRGTLRVVDWEAAGGDYEPWFDLSTAPIATVILACRQSGRSAEEVALPMLSAQGWTGATMARIVREHWTYPIPTGWGIALTAIHMALRRSAENRAMPSEYVDLVSLLMSDTALRSNAIWAVP